MNKRKNCATEQKRKRKIIQKPKNNPNLSKIRLISINFKTWPTKKNID